MLKPKLFLCVDFDIVIMVSSLDVCLNFPLYYLNLWEDRLAELKYCYCIVLHCMVLHGSVCNMCCIAMYSNVLLSYRIALVCIPFQSTVLYNM